MTTFLTVLGLLLGLSQVIPFWHEAFQGQAKPNIVSWSTWTLLTMIAATVAFAGGNWRVGLVILGNALATGSVVVVGLWKGYAKMTRLDFICQLLALLGLVAWPFLHTITVTVAATVLVDALALLPTLHHAWRRPQEEAVATYILAAAGSLCGLFVSSVGWASVYPMYLVLADGLVAATVAWRRRGLGW